MSDPVATLTDIPDGGSIRCAVGGKEVAVFRKGEDVYAIDAVCPHRGGPLNEAELQDEFVAVCPWHGWGFDIRDGKAPLHPGRVCTYKAEVRDGRVYIQPEG